jgi:glycine reductase
MKEIVHYLNQFYGQIGGEEFADQTPIIRDGPIGPGVALQSLLAEEAQITSTIICGDNYFADHQDEALEKILALIDEKRPEMLIAGPGFNAGRYGLACGTVCDAVKSKFSIPVLTALYPENPGAEMFKKTVYIVKAPISAAGMKKVMPAMGKLALKLLRGEEIGFPEEEGYIPQGFRINVHTEKNGAERGVDMLIKKLRGEPFTTELPMPVFDRVVPAPALKDLAHAKIALITSGGIVPQGNPDHIESANASLYGIYDITGLDNLTADKYMTVHGGYDPVYATEDPNRVLPLDAMRAIEREGGFGELYNHYYATVGNTTAVSNAKRYAEEIAQDMLRNQIQAAILTSN